jgi:hypothetical protein
MVPTVTALSVPPQANFLVMINRSTKYKAYTLLFHVLINLAKAINFEPEPPTTYISNHSNINFNSKVFYIAFGWIGLKSISATAN